MGGISSRYHPHIIQISPTCYPNITNISSIYYPHIIQISSIYYTYHPNITHIHISSKYHPYITHISSKYHPDNIFTARQLEFSSRYGKTIAGETPLLEGKCRGLLYFNSSFFCLLVVFQMSQKF